MMYTYTGFSCSVNLFLAQERLGRVCVQFFESQRPRAQHGPAHLVRTHSFASVRGIRLSVLNPCRTGGPHQCANMNCRVGAAHHVVSHCEHQQRRAFDKQFELVHSSCTCGRRQQTCMVVPCADVYLGPPCVAGPNSITYLSARWAHTEAVGPFPDMVDSTAWHACHPCTLTLCRGCSRLRAYRSCQPYIGIGHAFLLEPAVANVSCCHGPWVVIVLRLPQAGMAWEGKPSNSL